MDDKPKRPKTGGRKKGTPNKRTVAATEAAQQAALVLAEALGEHAFPGDAHALLMSVYKDTRLAIDLRADAAKAALPYEKPRLQSTTLSGNLGVTHEERLAFLEGDPITEGIDDTARH
jgi:hypothetical protein